MLKELFKGSFGVGVSYLIIALFLILAGLAVDRVFFEPQRQQGYVFTVSQELNDWCGGKVNDPFNQQTLSDLTAQRDGKPGQYAQLTTSMQSRINAAVRGDRLAACGHK